MKLKSLSIAIAFSVSGVMSSTAANMIINNVDGGAGVDRLFANVNGSLMTSGKVSIGYFDAAVTLANIDTIPELYNQLKNGTGGSTNLGSFISVTTGIPGVGSNDFGTDLGGYLAQTAATNIGVIGNANPLIGRTVYGISTDALNFLVGTNPGDITATSSFALFTVGTIVLEPGPQSTYNANPAGKTIHIGTLGNFNGTLGDAGTGDFSTLQMAAVPEPSAALLGAIGALGLLRRRRN